MPQVIVVCLSLILLCLILKPVALVIFYFFVRPLVHPFAIEQLRLFQLPINWPFAAVMIASAAFYAVTKKRFNLFPENSISLYLLLFLALLSSVTSLDLVASISQSIKMLNALSLVLVVTYAASSKQNIINIYKGIAISSVVPMVYGYYQFAVGAGHIVRGEHTDRITSFFGFANLYGMFLALILFVSLILYFEESRRKWKRVYGAIFVSAVVSSILSLNRGSWIAIVLGVLLSFPFYRRYLTLKWLVIGFSAIAVGASGIIVDRFLELEQRVLGADTFGGRIAIAQAIVSRIGEIPILGYGPGTAQFVLDTRFGLANVPHNDYLRLLLEMGFLAPILFVVLLGREFFLNLKNRHHFAAWNVNYFTLAIIIYFVVISAVQNVVHDAVVFPLFLVCCVLARKYDKFSARPS